MVGKGVREWASDNGLVAVGEFSFAASGHSTGGAAIPTCCRREFLLCTKQKAIRIWYFDFERVFASPAVNTAQTRLSMGLFRLRDQSTRWDRGFGELPTPEHMSVHPSIKCLLEW